jgi:hypothetical protein
MGRECREHGESFLAAGYGIRAEPAVPEAAASGQMGEVAKRREAAEQAKPAALVTGTGAAGPPHPESRAALGEHAGNVAGIRDAIDRRHREPEGRPAKSGRESGGVINKGGRNINSQGLHFARLQVILNNVQYE